MPAGLSSGQTDSPACRMNRQASRPASRWVLSRWAGGSYTLAAGCRGRQYAAAAGRRAQPFRHRRKPPQGERERPQNRWRVALTVAPDVPGRRTTWDRRRPPPGAAGPLKTEDHLRPSDTGRSIPRRRGHTTRHQRGTSGKRRPEDDAWTITDRINLMKKHRAHKNHQWTTGVVMGTLL